MYLTVLFAVYGLTILLVIHTLRDTSFCLLMFIYSISFRFYFYYSAFVNFYTVSRVTSRGRPMTLAWLAGWSLSHSRMRLRCSLPTITSTDSTSPQINRAPDAVVYVPSLPRREGDCVAKSRNVRIA